MMTQMERRRRKVVGARWSERRTMFWTLCMQSPPTSTRRADHTLDVGHAVLDTKEPGAACVIREGDVRADEGARGGADRDGEHGVAAEVRVVHARQASSA